MCFLVSQSVSQTDSADPLVVVHSIELIEERREVQTDVMRAGGRAGKVSRYDHRRSWRRRKRKRRGWLGAESMWVVWLNSLSLPLPTAAACLSCFRPYVPIPTSNLVVCRAPLLSSHSIWRLGMRERAPFVDVISSSARDECTLCFLFFLFTFTMMNNTWHVLMYSRVRLIEKLIIGKTG